MTTFKSNVISCHTWNINSPVFLRGTCCAPLRSKVLTRQWVVTFHDSYTTYQEPDKSHNLHIHTHIQKHAFARSKSHVYVIAYVVEMVGFGISVLYPLKGNEVTNDTFSVSTSQMDSQTCVTTWSSIYDLWAISDYTTAGRLYNR